MATKVETITLDDLNGETGARSVLFSLDGRTYEIDLTDSNADKLRKCLEPYTSKGRHVAKGKFQAHAPARPRAGRPDMKSVREWAQANGYTVSTRGRIPTDIQEAYDSAQGS